MKNIFRKIKKLSLRSIILNFYLLPFKQAVKLPLLFARNVKISAIYRGGVQLNSDNIFPGMIQIGYNFIGNLDGKYERSIVEISKPGKVVFLGRASLGSGTRLNVHGTLSFGDSVTLNGNTNICCLSNVEIGEKTLVSWDCLFMDTDFHKIYVEENLINENKPITIGKNCWIGCRTTFLKGSELADNSVVGAGSLVNKKLNKENCIYAGNPAKMIKENVRWKE